MIIRRAEALTAEDQSFDAVVLSVVLCSVPDPAHTLADIQRALGPDGELRVYEHVRSPGQRARLEGVVTDHWARAGGGCHPSRNTAAALAEAGFDTTQLD